MQNLKEILDELVKKYETTEFIKNDPVGFLHKFETKQDIEIAGIISSALAYGKREAFIEKLKIIYSILGDSPYDFCMEFDKNKYEKYFQNFKYRFNTGADIICLLEKLHFFYRGNNSLESFVEKMLANSENKAKQAVAIISDMLCENICEKSYCYLFPHPKANSACKRLNLFLKWMVRKSCVDRGIWEVLKPSDLIIPLDVHVAKVSRHLKLTSRKSNDWQTAEEITSKLREFDANDPVKYDFALFDIGIEKIDV